MIGGVTLTRSALVTSRLGFGTSRLHYMSARARADILGIAVDLGLRHIDTAPAYGDGLAERAVGDALRGKRDSIVLATKVGLPPHPLSDRVPALGGAVRALRVARQVLPVPLPRRQPITPDGVRLSLEASLRRLRVDYVDVLFLHEPSANAIPDPDGVLRALWTAKRDGLTRHVGLAGGWAGIAALGEAFFSEPMLIQTHEDQWPEEYPPDIAYGALSAGPQSFGTSVRLSTDNARKRLLRALSRRPKQSLLVSTTNADRLRSLAAAAQSEP